jgi:peptide/nickel transport system permease protein
MTASDTPRPRSSEHEGAALAVGRETPGAAPLSAAGEAALLPPPARRGPLAGRSWPGLVLDFCRRRTLGATGGLVIILMMLAALLADVIVAHNPYEGDFLAQLKPPDAEYILGTDAFGRDVFSRLIHGSRTALKIGFGAAFVGAAIGTLLGVISAYFGGRVDLTLERIMDVLISFPLLVLALAVVSALGNNDTNVIIAITVPIIPRVSRVIRASALSIRQMPYVEAARCIGAGDSRIILRHMLPNVMAPFLILVTAFLGQAILSEASLSFLGLGVSEPTPAWGLMLRGASAQFIERAPWLAIAPGIALSLAVFAFNLLGDSLRDALDPRLRL